MKKYSWLVFCILLVFCFGCTHFEGYGEIVKDERISREYLNVLDKWTKDKTVYSQFETKVRIVATYKDSEFNKAYLSEYSKIYSLTEPEKKSREETLTGLSSDFTEFLFYAYTPDKDSNDFDKQDSVWTIFLLDKNGNKVYPVEVRKIKKITPIVKEFYPYINKYYGMFYSLKYPPLSSTEGDPKHLKLVFTSVLGRVELEW
ncbi:MAG: hypothetical protein U9M96_06150 [Thermodesulfobacteriota bacterium]|nr:hypothetical protein [Thermodesulfobacteriota bacterium]